MYPRLFFTVLPALLGAIAPSLALPVQSAGSLLVETRPFSLSSDRIALLSRDMSAELLAKRDYQDGESHILAHTTDETLFSRSNKNRLSAEDAKARKAAVRANVAHRQALNAAKKAHLQAQDVPQYGRPNNPKYTKTTTSKGTKHIVSGFRAEHRQQGRRLAKQPKKPRANFAKGEHEKDEKAMLKQAEAKARLQEKKAKGQAAHAIANARYAQTLAHGNMPNRHDEYHVPNHDVIYGKGVRTGAYNLGMYKDVKRLPYPVKFKNLEQGPPTNRHQPLPHMIGPGHEYPINNDVRGYHATTTGGQGPVRGIYQDNAAGGYNIMGVVSHDVTLPKTHPGYRDHHEVHRLPAFLLDGLEGTVLG